MAVPLWGIKLAIMGIKAAFKYRKDKKKRKEVLTEIRREVPEMQNIGVMLEWIFKLKFFKKYRSKIGAGSVAISAILLALSDTALAEAFPVLVSIAKWALPAGTYFGIIGAKFKDDPDD